MSEALPKAKLADLVQLNPKLRNSLGLNDLVSFIPMASIDAETGTTFTSEARKYSEVSKGYTPFENGDILVAKITPCFENGKLTQAKISYPVGFGSTEFHVLRPRTGELDSRYLLHYLRQERVRRDGERKMTGSAGQRRVPLHFLENLEVPIPSLTEQRRIAAVLDQVEVLRAKRREALAGVEGVTQSIFFDMFGDPRKNPQGWSFATLGRVTEFYAGGTLPRGEAYRTQTDGYFLMRVSDMNLAGNETLINKCQEWSRAPGSRSATCPPGSVVIPKRGGAIGTNKKRLTIRSCILDPNLMGIRPRPELLRLSYLYQWFLQFDLAGITSGSSVPQLNKRDLDPLPILLPPVPLQEKFADKTAVVHHMKTSHRAHLAELDALFASLQYRAFRGEL